MKLENYTDPFAKMVAEKAASLQLNQQEKGAALKQAKADQRAEDRREAAIEMHETLKSQCPETVLFLRSSPSVILNDHRDTDFHIYMCCDKVGRRTRVFCRSTTMFDEEMMRTIIEDAIGDDYPIIYKGDGQHQISSIEWDCVPEIINKLCEEAQGWL